VFKTSNYAKSHRQPSVDFSLKDIRGDEDISLKKGISEKTIKKDNANGDYLKFSFKNHKHTKNI